MKNLKLMTLVALVCYGQSVLALNDAERAVIKNEIDSMTEQQVDNIATKLKGGSIGYNRDGSSDFYKKLDGTSSKLCTPREYLLILGWVNELRETDATTFESIMNNYKRIDYPSLKWSLLQAVIGDNYEDIALARDIIAHIMQNRNYTINIK